MILKCADAKYFNRSWQQRAQSNTNEDSFWEEYHHDRVLCRAIAGYPDLFPKIDLVPKLPANLQSTCMSLSDIINQETDIHEKLGKFGSKQCYFTRHEK